LAPDELIYGFLYGPYMIEFAVGANGGGPVFGFLEMSFWAKST
jgi:hypothetical protein